MSIGTTRALFYGFGIVLGLVALVGVLSVWNAQRMIETNRWVFHTHDVLIRIEECHSDWNEALASQRTYFLTGNPRFTVQYQEAKKNAFGELDELRHLTADNSHQIDRLDQLGPLLNQQFQLVEQEMSVEKKSGMAGVQRAITADSQVAELQEKIDSFFQAMKEEEENLRTLRIDRAERTRSQVFSGFITIFLIDFGLLAILFSLVRSDLHRRQRVEAEVREARDAALEATQAKAAFLANMSHEIRTPLNGVIGMTELLLNTRLDSEQKSFVETIQLSGETLLEVINEILDFSKIEAGKMRLEREPFDLRECVEGALSVLSRQAAQKNLELIYEMDAQAPMICMGDMTRLRQVLTNLISNAVKFTPAGTILIKVSTFGTPKPGQDVVLLFSISDTGIGIPAGKIDKLFKSFSQVDESTTRQYGGTGLGLAICKSLVGMMGGSISVQSEEGKGSTFSFTWPTEMVKAQAERFAPERCAHLTGCRILVVDDNETNRRILSGQISQWGAISQTVSDAKEALILLESDASFDLAIYDERMPEIDGVELAAQTRKISSRRKMPIVLLTSENLNRDTSVYAEAGLSSAVQKPIRQSQLFDVLRQVLTGEAILIEELGKFSVDQQWAKSLRVLVAEDNPVNQQVVTRMLERLGIHCDLVDNGEEVLQKLEQQRFDIVFMDVQMPKLDGIAAAKKIIETCSGAERPRIIALTANALKGDREKYLAAGMDDYISKPIQMAELIRVLQPPAGLAPALNEQHMKELEAMQDGDPEFLKDLIKIYLEDAPQRVEQMEKALKQKDGELLRREAHTLKGSSSHFGADRLVDACLQLEHAARDLDWAESETLVSSVRREFGQVEQALKNYPKS